MTNDDVGAPIRIRKDADAAGIRPEDCQAGATFFIARNEKGFIVESEQRAGKNGKFTQYTLHVTDTNGNARRLNYLFEKHLAPLSRDFQQDDPQQWEVGKEIIVTGFQKKDSKFWDVKLDAVEKPIEVEE